MVKADVTNTHLGAASHMHNDNKARYPVGLVWLDTVYGLDDQCKIEECILDEWTRAYAELDEVEGRRKEKDLCLHHNPINYQLLGEVIQRRLQVEMDDSDGKKNDDDNVSFTVIFGHQFGFHIDFDDTQYAYVQLKSYDRKMIRDYPEGMHVVCVLLFKPDNKAKPRSVAECKKEVENSSSSAARAPPQKKPQKAKYLK